MKIKSLKTGNIVDILPKSSGENAFICPDCVNDRKKQNAKPLRFNAEKGVGKCHHCESKFVEFVEQVKKKEYSIPEWKNKTELTNKAAKWFHDRGIEEKVIKEMGISSATEFMPQLNKDVEVICFPFYQQGKLVNIKYRGPEKSFKLYSNAELILYNVDCLYDNEEVIIVEGEMDCLSLMQIGLKNVVSVPNGASIGSMEYMDSVYEVLQTVERFILATDNDTPGIKLRDELIRRLGAERCAVVDWGDCKDANEFLIKHGGFDLNEKIRSAKDVPVGGIIYSNDVREELDILYKEGLKPGAKLSIPALDELITWEMGRLGVVTGIPSHGKTEFVKFITVLMNLIHGWKVASFSYESYPPALFYSSVVTTIVGRSFNEKYLPKEELNKTLDYVTDNFFLIYPEKDLSVDNILEKAKYLVKKNGVKVLVLDPYNKFEHMRDRGESETEYVSRFLDKLSVFAKQNNILVLLVAHPYKMKKEKDSMKYEVPTLYDISGSAHFYNKPDYGVIVYRDFANQDVLIRINKVKFKHLGKIGDIRMEFDLAGDRYFISGDEHDHKSWLNKKWGQIEQQSLPWENPDKFIEEQNAPF